MAEATRPAESADRTVLALRLPNLGDEGQPGARFIRRAVTWTLSVLALLVVAATLVAFTVSMDVTVKAPGVLEPVRMFPVRAQESGAVREVLVQTGDTVQAGEVVIRLDPLGLETELARLEGLYRAAEIDRRRSATATPLEQREQADRTTQAQARLGAARAALRQRMAEHMVGTNVDSLLAVHRPGGHVALDQAVGEVRSAEAELRLIATQSDKLALSRFDRERTATEMDQLATQIRATRERMERMSVVAPSTGVVLTERIERLPGSFVREGDMLLEVANLEDWRVTLVIPERSVHKVAVGDSVKVDVQAFDPNTREQLRGQVAFVASEPLGTGTESGQGSPAAPAGPGMYRVVVALDPEQLAEVGIEKFRRGYSVEGQVITRSGKISKLIWDYVMEKVQG